MNHASGRGPVPPAHPDDDDHQHLGSSLKKDWHVKNHIIDRHIETTPLLNSVASASFHKAQPSPPDSLSVKIDLSIIGGASADDDSGLPDSSYKTSSSLKNSICCSDSTYGDSEEDRPGSFDYMPSQSHVRITHSFNPPYDEEVRVDSGTDGSSVESPRSETSVTHDEYNLADEGTEMSTISYKETPRPFSRERKHSDDCWDYILGGKRPTDDNMEDEDDDRERQRSSRNTSSYVSSYPRSAPVQVDEGVSYGLKQANVLGLGQSARLMTVSSYNKNRDLYISEENKDRKKSQNKAPTN